MWEGKDGSYNICGWFDGVWETAGMDPIEASKVFENTLFSVYNTMIIVLFIFYAL